GNSGATIEEDHGVHHVEALSAPVLQIGLSLLRRILVHERPHGVAHPEERGTVPDEVPAVLADRQHRTSAGMGARCARNGRPVGSNLFHRLLLAIGIAAERGYPSVVRLLSRPLA